MPWAVRILVERLSGTPVIDWSTTCTGPSLVSLDVLEHIADWSRDSSIMLLALARPEFYESRPTWGGGKLNATAVLLPTLDEAATVSLMEQHDLPVAVMRRIADAAGGNPLFAEQLVAMLVHQGNVACRDGVGTWIGGPPDEVE